MPETIQSTIPDELRIGITNKCDLNCKHCYVHEKDDSARTVELETYLSLLEELKSHLKSISITGGDPLIVKDDIFVICKKCKENGIKVRLVTNGTMLTDL